MTRQGDIFAQSEGDRWFARNREALLATDPLHDLPLRLMSMYQLRPANVLEIGAANGARLALIRDQFEARCVAVEPSLQAITDGKARYPFLEFVQAQAHDVPLRDAFDLVIVNFVLHWVDRPLLLRAVAEVDRLLCDGGFLLLGDFLPRRPTRVPYHHLPPDVYTYKQDYAAFFLASGLYQLVAALAGRHGEAALDAAPPEDDRVAAWLLKKRTAYDGPQDDGAAADHRSRSPDATLPPA
jgi:SAM-dependent methyltransferase